METAIRLMIISSKRKPTTPTKNEQFKRMNTMCTMGMDKKKDSKKTRKLIKKNSTPQQPAAEPQSKPQTDDTEHKH